jgi:hypothetical protein
MMIDWKSRLIGAIVLATFAGQTSATEQVFLVTAHEGSLDAQSVSISGESYGRRIAVTVERRPSGGDIRIAVAIDGAPLGEYVVSAERVPKADLSTVEVRGAFPDRFTVVVEFLYSEPTECFVNHDGRPHHSVAFEADHTIHADLV